MERGHRVFLWLLFGLFACRSEPAPGFEISAADRDAIRALLDDQKNAWNEGDLEGYMGGYHDSPEIVFTSGGRVRRGYQQSLEAYWSRPDIRKDRLYLNCRGESIEIGSFLIEEEKTEIKGELDLALYRFRNNLLSPGS